VQAALRQRLTPKLDQGFPRIYVGYCGNLRIIKSGFLETAAIMKQGKKFKKNGQKPLDMFSTKRGRGRPLKVVPSAVRGRADNYRVWLGVIWKDLGVPLLASQNEQDVVEALQMAVPGNTELIPFAPLILKVVKNAKFPMRRKAQINFLADSIAGLGLVTPRRSRDICAEQRSLDLLRHQILRYEYWIECSCGYKGRSEYHKCKKCGAVLYGS
jgi:hypothetical protein